MVSRFRWAQCQLDTLEFCSSSEEIDQVLESLPNGLPATYERILARVDERQFRNVWLVLLSLAFAARPLTIDQVANLLRIDPRLKLPTKKITIYHSRLLAACSSLVSTFSSTGDLKAVSGSPKAYLRLAYLSVKEYLLSEEIKRSSVGAFWMSRGLGNRVMAELCISCLLQNDNVLSFGRQTLDTFPLTTYAAESWELHVGEANDEAGGRELLDRLLFSFVHESSPDVHLNRLRVSGGTFHIKTSAGMVRFGPPWYDAAIPPSVVHSEIEPELRALVTRIWGSTLSMATRHNLWRTVEAILRARQPSQAEMDDAMSVGLESHAYDALESLVAFGKADVNSRSGFGEALTLLERCETPRSVRWLVAHGAVIHPDPRFRHPLHTLCSGTTRLNLGHPSATARDDVVACLLELGADPDTAFEYRYGSRPGVWLSTPLQQAAYDGELNLVGILLDNGATINLVQGRVGSGLHAAAIGGRDIVFRHLLAKGADIHAVGDQYGSVLWAAGYGGSKDIVKTCLEQGLCWDEFIDVKLEGTRGREWKTLDCDTQEQLITRVIKVSKERHSSLAEAILHGMVSLDEAIQLGRSFGIDDEVLDELGRTRTWEAPDSPRLRLRGKKLTVLWNYPFQVKPDL